MDQHLQTDGMTESERASALARLVQEFAALKGKGNDELVHKKRQRLLALWGELVLARIDPNADNKEISDPEIPEVNEEKGSLSEEVVQEAGTAVSAYDDHSKSHSDPEYSLHEEAPHTELSDQGEKAEFIDEETHETEEVTPEQSPIHAQELNSQLEITPVLDPLPTDEHEVEHETISKPAEFDVDTNENVQSDTVLQNIIETDTSHRTEYVISDLADREYSEIHLSQAPTTSHDEVEKPLIKIAEVDTSHDKPLLEIKEISDDLRHAVALKIGHQEPEHHRNSTMIRLRLLKTGVLHDLVLPQGTIVSTNAADAEELIASGTAEKLLLQTDDDDDDWS